jgi:hypothetical protein
VSPRCAMRRCQDVSRQGIRHQAVRCGLRRGLYYGSRETGKLCFCTVRGARVPGRAGSPRVTGPGPATAGGLAQGDRCGKKNGRESTKPAGCRGRVRRETPDGANNRVTRPRRPRQEAAGASYDASRKSEQERRGNGAETGGHSRDATDRTAQLLTIQHWAAQGLLHAPQEAADTFPIKYPSVINSEPATTLDPRGATRATRPRRGLVGVSDSGRSAAATDSRRVAWTCTPDQRHLRCKGGIYEECRLR